MKLNRSQNWLIQPEIIYVNVVPLYMEQNLVNSIWNFPTSSGRQVSGPSPSFNFYLHQQNSSKNFCKELSTPESQSLQFESKQITEQNYQTNSYLTTQNEELSDFRIKILHVLSGMQLITKWTVLNIELNSIILSFVLIL